MVTVDFSFKAPAGIDGRRSLLLREPDDQTYGYRKSAQGLWNAISIGGQNEIQVESLQSFVLSGFVKLDIPLALTRTRLEVHDLQNIEAASKADRQVLAWFKEYSSFQLSTSSKML